MCTERELESPLGQRELGRGITHPRAHFSVGATAMPALFLVFTRRCTNRFARLPDPRVSEWLYGSMGRLVDFHPFTLHFNPSLSFALSFASIRDPSVRRNAISLQVGASKRAVRPPSCPTGDGRMVGRSAARLWQRQTGHAKCQSQTLRN